MTKVGLNDVIHGHLEGGRGIAEPKWHYFELVMSMMGFECCLGNIVWVHPYLMIPLKKAELRKTPCSPQFIQQLIYGGDGKSILHCQGI